MPLSASRSACCVVAHWRVERSTLGHARNDYAFCAVYRRVYLRNFSVSSFMVAVGQGWTMVLMTAALSTGEAGARAKQVDAFVNVPAS